MSSQKKMLVDAIKQSMIKPPTPQSKTQSQKKPENYESYLNTAIDYTKSHDTPYLVGSTVKKSKVVYSLDSDESPKEDQQEKNVPNTTIPEDDDLMNQIEREIYFQNGKESEANPENQTQRKIVKPTGPKRKTNLKSIEEESDNDSRAVSQAGGIKSQQIIKRSKLSEEPEEQAKILTEEDETLSLPPKVRGKVPTSIPSSSHLNPVAVFEPMKKLKQALGQKLPMKIEVNIKLLRKDLKVMRIKQCQGETNETIRYICELEDDEQAVLNNTEMTNFYKDPLINYYQNFHFS